MKLTRFYRIYKNYYFCLSTYGGMGYGMNEDYVSYDRVFTFIYKRRDYQETMAYFAGLRERFQK